MIQTIIIQKNELLQMGLSAQNLFYWRHFMRKKTWLAIFRYLLAIGLFLAYSALFDNQDHDLIRSTLVFAICLGISIIPFKRIISFRSKDKNKK